MNIEEAGAALLGGADILDVKNPKEGSLGANFPWAIRAVAGSGCRSSACQRHHRRPGIQAGNRQPGRSLALL